MAVYTGSRSVSALMLNVGNRWTWVNFTPRPLYPLETASVPIEWWSPELVWSVLEMRICLCWNSNPGPSGPWLVAVPTASSWLPCSYIDVQICSVCYTFKWYFFLQKLLILLLHTYYLFADCLLPFGWECHVFCFLSVNVEINMYRTYFMLTYEVNGLAFR